jgi:predicted DNA-binding protein with PD1-like motif
MPYRQTEGAWVVRLETGDLVQEKLSAFCKDHRIASGTVHAIGALKWARLGYFDQESDPPAYLQKEFKGGFELLSCTGNVSRKADGSFFCHLHCVLGDRQMNVIGGHLFEGEVGPTFECYIYPAPTRLKRFAGPDSPLELLDV